MQVNLSSVKDGLPIAIKQREIADEEIVFFYNLLKSLKEQEFKSSNEEKAKNYLNDFIKSLNYYTELNIGCDIGGGIDLAILNKESKKVNVILESKVFEAGAMITDTDFNKKAFHEAVRYYLYQRIVEGNIETKRIIITDYESWYIIDASEFYRLFVKDVTVKSSYIKWRNGKLDGKGVTVFYDDVVKKFLTNESLSINAIKFSLSDYKTDNSDYNKLNKANQIKIQQLYQLLSPDFLLKEFRESDNNKLNNDFYKELLHIIGLQQEEKNGKIIIVRRDDNENDSLIGNTISSLEDEIFNFEDKGNFGNTNKIAGFNIGLELCLTWINRILFLKLLEGQLLTYHNGDPRYKFLDFAKEWSYQELDKLFFKVLAKQEEDRDEIINQKYGHVPYLNSSLFTPTVLEHKVGHIKSLEGHKKTTIYKNTKLTDESGKTLKGNLDTLTYLLRFLSAYNFSAEEDKKANSNLISASVLGLIFEKINGYEEGAIFTPSQITMMMSRDVLRSLVIKRFNKAFGLDSTSFDEQIDDFNGYIRLNKIRKEEIRRQANDLINGLKICDIAVGSGHFLVSSLNELITIKNQLGILCYKGDYGNRLEFGIETNNDELIIEDIDGNPFKYRPGNEKAQKIQETLFHEKQTIIENCLYGVDINAKSVQICQLRLWIELLKNSFYTKKSGFKHLETLPNIDINIKKGNSLLYRFDLESDWKDLDNAQEDKSVNIEAYRNAVVDYKHNNGNKDEVKAKIEEFKNNLRSTFSQNDVSNKKLKLIKQYISASTLKHNVLFDGYEETLFLSSVLKTLKDNFAKPKKGEVVLTNTDWEKINFSRSKLTESNMVPNLKKLERMYEEEVKEKENSILYKTAFEWRIEFPEVLDNEGKFKGFDSIIANPPYMNIQTISRTQPRLKELYENNYEVAKGGYEFANLFIELAHRLSAEDCENTFIFPHKFLNSDNGEELRNYLLKKRSIHTMLHFGANRVFRDADTFTCVIQFNSAFHTELNFYRTPYRADWALEMVNKNNYQKISYDDVIKINQWYKGNKWHLLDNQNEYKLLEKIYANSTSLDDVCEDIFQGLATGKDEVYIVDMIEENSDTYRVIVPLDGKEWEVEKTFFKPMVRGKDVKRYEQGNVSKYIFFPYSPEGKNDPRKTEELVVSEDILAKNFPLTFQYVNFYKPVLIARERGKAVAWRPFYNHSRPQNLSKFEQLKLSSMEICTIYPNVIMNTSHLYHSTKVYSWILREDATISYPTLLAIANSKLLWWFMKRTADTLKDDARTFKTNYLNPFPIPNELDEHTVLMLEDKIAERQKMSENFDLMDKEIDSLVYDLYKLDLEERQVIEEGVLWGWEKMAN